jgi:DNA-3-methyladenine glycosylase I
MHGDQALFELLCLEGAQAGLSWSSILNRRDGYREAFDGFDIEMIASYSPDRAAALLQDQRIIRNRAKVSAFTGNAQAALRLLESGSSLDKLLWSFTGGETIVNTWGSMAEVPAWTAESKSMSDDLKRRGFRFVGPTICYAFMQSAGMVNDHLVACFRYRELTG